MKIQVMGHKSSKRRGSVSKNLSDKASNVLAGKYTQAERRPELNLFVENEGETLENTAAFLQEKTNRPKKLESSLSGIKIETPRRQSKYDLLNPLKCEQADAEMRCSEKEEVQSILKLIDDATNSDECLKRAMEFVESSRTKPG